MSWEDKIAKVLDYHKQTYGLLESGDRAAYVLNDAVVVIGLMDGTLSIDIVAGEPDKLDISLDLEEK